MTFFLHYGDREFERVFSSILLVKRETDKGVDVKVSSILDDVRNRGDEAIIELTKKYDRFDLTTTNMRIDKAEVERAYKQCDEELLRALELAAKRITEFHEHQLPVDLDYVDKTGIRLGYKWNAMASVRLYVPGGTAVYPSSVLMNALPAKVAGVGRLVIVVPTPNGKINPIILAAARIAGVDEIYRIGGAQAIGALAYGTHTVGSVDKIVGPGNAYVAAAKRQVFGTVGIDMIAGPSEILVVADSENDPNWIAADLLSQAEHDTAAQAILITDNREFGEKVSQAVETSLRSLPRASIASKSWQEFGAIIVVKKLSQAIPLIDKIAPEHLELAIAKPDFLAEKIRNAGAIFLGRYTPEALGDYLAGPNHVLPTARSSRFSSGLGVLDFMKRSSFVGANAESLSEVSSAAVLLAKAEGLEAHARSITIRLNRWNEEK